MATVADLTSVKCALKLNNGTTEAGNVKTVSLSLATLDATQWATDALATASNTKVLAIVNAIMPCLEIALYQTTLTRAYSIYEN